LIYHYQIDNLLLTTGDLICITKGDYVSTLSQIMRPIEWCMYGAVKHVTIYVGLGGHCVEAGPGGVIAFDLAGKTWQAEPLRQQRRGMGGTLYGVAYPLWDSRYSRNERIQIRTEVARYCLEQAEMNKPYNWNVLDSEREDAFYCSQLAYKAYRPFEIDLNSERGIPNRPLLRSIVFPQEVWSGCAHRRPPHRRVA
jgi:uncharacterized protein YycO